jgi:serine/threonine protein kinase
VLVAVKRLKDGAVAWEARQYASETALLSRVSHPNICGLLAISDDGPCKCLVLELCTGGALDRRLSCQASGAQPAPEPLPWQQRVRVAFGIASALSHLHSLPMVHRDVKTANVLLDDRGSAKVADFGTVLFCLPIAYCCVLLGTYTSNANRCTKASGSRATAHG